MARKRSTAFSEQREAILDVAAMLFARQGYHAASMAALAQACGVSKALLYHYYRDKEHMLFDVASTHVDRLVALVQQRLPANEPTPSEARAALTALIADLLHEYAHAQHRHIVLVQDVKHLPPALREEIRHKQRLVVKGVERLVAACLNASSPALVGALTMTLFGMINWTFTWLRADGPLTHEQLAPIVAALFFDGIAGAQRAFQDKVTAGAVTIDPTAQKEHAHACRFPV